MFQAGERRSLGELQSRFADVPPALGSDEARIEASRCLFCFDAPCTRACPTHIDVPRFIRQILHHDEISAATTILEANIFGGSCAGLPHRGPLRGGVCRSRAHEGTGADRSPSALCLRCGSRSGAPAFEPGHATGKRVAVIGSGPAGLSCAA